MASTTTTRRSPPARTPSRSTRSRLFSPLLSPPAEDATNFDDLQEERQSQRNVYDVAPPPGYKRLKKVRGSRNQVWADAHPETEQTPAYVDYSPGGVYTARYQSYTAHQEKLFQQLPVRLLGDGFSGDEAKTRKTKKRARSDNSSNSAGSSNNKKRKKTNASPILGSLDIIPLSQEERTIDMAAAAAAAFASALAVSKIKDIIRMIPLRPVPQVPPGMIWEFDDENSLAPEGVANADTGKVVAVVPSSCGENGQVVAIEDDEAAVPCSLLPSLRRAYD